MSKTSLKHAVTRGPKHPTVAQPPRIVGTLPPLPSEVGSVEAALAPQPEPEATASKPEAAAAPAAAERTVHPRTTPRYADTDVIVVGPKGNPKRPGGASYARFALYTPGMTTKEYISHRKVGGYGRADIAWDVAHGFITLVSAEEWAAREGGSGSAAGGEATVVAAAEAPDAVVTEAAAVTIGAQEPAAE